MSKFMRILVFFDLPVGTKTERRQATQFRNELLKDGYYMIQFSVYGRVCNGVEAAAKHNARLAKFAPQHGSIRVLTITEKQYESMQIIWGNPKYTDASQPQQLSLFF
jgi:CRISPR-associated protein Cas2